MFSEKHFNLQDFKERLRELVIYTLPKECRDDEDIVESYFQSFLFAFEEFKSLKNELH